MLPSDDEWPRRPAPRYDIGPNVPRGFRFRLLALSLICGFVAAIIIAATMGPS